MMLFLLGCDAGGPSAADGPTSGALRVLSYNVHGLPSVITADDTPARIAQIGPRLNGYDVVGLQEAWDPVEVLDVLDETVTLDPAGDSAAPLEGRAYGTGLLAYSALPVVTFDGGYYSTCYGTFDNASDCLASKGWLRSQLELAPGFDLDLVGTHMEAGNDPNDDAARLTQVSELLAGVSSDRPVVMLGDFNMSRDDPEDAPMLLQIEAAGFVDACDPVACAEPNRIDHIYVRDGGGVSLTVTAWAVETSFADDAGVPLSDHDPIAITMDWAR